MRQRLPRGTKMKIKERFVQAIEFAYSNAQKSGLEIRFGIPSAMAQPDLITQDESQLLADAGFVWDEGSQCWVTDVKDMFDAT
jgi:hypothetical protein